MADHTTEPTWLWDHAEYVLGEDTGPHPHIHRADPTRHRRTMCGRTSGGRMGNPAVWRARPHCPTCAAPSTPPRPAPQPPVQAVLF